MLDHHWNIDRITSIADANSSFHLDNQSALVTDASRGLGAETAIVLAAAGADLVISGHDTTSLEITRQAVERLGRWRHAVQTDFRSTEETHWLAEQALALHGTVDILVNNAGIVFVEDLLKTTLEHWDQTQAVNLPVTFQLTQKLIPWMINQGQEKIINISSISAVLAPEGHAAYSASKGGLNLLTQAIATEGGRYNIQANAVAATVILTEMGQKAWGEDSKGDPMKARIPARGFGQPNEVANPVLFLASNASDFICGHAIRVDGGLTAAWGDHDLNRGQFATPMLIAKLAFPSKVAPPRYFTAWARAKWRALPIHFIVAPHRLIFK